MYDSLKGDFTSLSLADPKPVGQLTTDLHHVQGSAISASLASLPVFKHFFPVVDK
jgi:hypothetical protein